MAEKMLEDFFRTLIGEMELDLRGYCGAYSQALAQPMMLTEVRPVEIKKIVRRDGELLLPNNPITIWKKWHLHYFVTYESEVWDPSFGKKFPAGEYLEQAFPDQDMIIKSVPLDSRIVSAFFSE